MHCVLENRENVLCNLYDSDHRQADNEEEMINSTALYIKQLVMISWQLQDNNLENCVKYSDIILLRLKQLGNSLLSGG